MNIYRVNDVDWVAAETAEDAFEFAREFYRGDDYCLEELLSVPEVVSEEEMDRFTRFEDDDGGEMMTFREALRRDMANGVPGVSSWLFATTEF